MKIKAFRTIKTKKGSSTVEYIVMFSTVIGVLIVFLSPSPAAPFRHAIDSALGSVSSGMEDMGARLSQSTPAAPRGTFSGGNGGGTPTTSSFGN